MSDDLTVSLFFCGNLSHIVTICFTENQIIHFLESLFCIVWNIKYLQKRMVLLRSFQLFLPIHLRTIISQTKFQCVKRLKGIYFFQCRLVQRQTYRRRTCSIRKSSNTETQTHWCFTQKTLSTTTKDASLGIQQNDLINLKTCTGKYVILNQHIYISLKKSCSQMYTCC